MDKNVISVKIVEEKKGKSSEHPSTSVVIIM
jgi:hypothetical protein